MDPGEIDHLMETPTEIVQLLGGSKRRPEEDQPEPEDPEGAKQPDETVPGDKQLEQWRTWIIKQELQQRRQAQSEGRRPAPIVDPILVELCFLQDMERARELAEMAARMEAGGVQADPAAVGKCQAENA